jgi:hypothetical protein
LLQHNQTKQHNVTSCEEETRILFNFFQNPPKLFSIIPKMRVMSELSGLMARAREWNEISAA